MTGCEAPVAEKRPRSWNHHGDSTLYPSIQRHLDYLTRDRFQSVERADWALRLQLAVWRSSHAGRGVRCESAAAPPERLSKTAGADELDPSLAAAALMKGDHLRALTIVAKIDGNRRALLADFGVSWELARVDRLPSDSDGSSCVCQQRNWL